VRFGWSIVGGYPPAYYLLDGIAGARFGTSTDAWYAMRVLGALTTAALLFAAYWLLCMSGRPPPRQRRWALTGLLLAVTPMVFFLGGGLGAQGPEICGGVATAAFVVRASRATPLRRADWVLGASVLAAFACSRLLVLLWIPLYLLLFVALAGRRGALDVLRAGGRTAAIGLGVAATAYASTLLWSQAQGLRSPLPWSDLGTNLRRGSRDLRGTAKQALGVFGWQDTPLSPGHYWLWALAIAVLIALALYAADRRSALVLIGLAAAIVVVTLALAALIFEPADFGMQGRYVLPLAVALPILAGEVIGRFRARLPRVVDAVALVLGAGAVILGALAWVVVARRYALGASSGGLVHRSADAISHLAAGDGWQPPGGSVLWLSVIALSAASGAAAVLRAGHARA
jgi:hypothetical protein